MLASFQIRVAVYSLGYYAGKHALSFSCRKQSIHRLLHDSIEGTNRIKHASITAKAKVKEQQYPKKCNFEIAKQHISSSIDHKRVVYFRQFKMAFTLLIRIGFLA